jgi:hypothetical protein
MPSQQRGKEAGKAFVAQAHGVFEQLPQRVVTDAILLG